MRRGCAAVPTYFGPGTAIVTGNALFFTRFEALAECASRGVFPTPGQWRRCAYRQGRPGHALKGYGP
ncbi:hypothetical protein J7E89_36620 [Streptomyces sp. ISL-100]|nr:hypothetical protein [Streptomyces sp. ISL-100]